MGAGVYGIPGRGTVATGLVEAGTLKIGDALELIGLKPLSKKTVCTGVEMFNKTLDAAQAGMCCMCVCVCMYVSVYLCVWKGCEFMFCGNWFVVWFFSFDYFYKQFHRKSPALAQHQHTHTHTDSCMFFRTHPF